MYRYNTEQTSPISMVPFSPPGEGEREWCPAERGKGQSALVCSPSQLLQMWQNLHLPKGHWHFPSFQEWQNGVRRRESRLPEEDWGDPERGDDRGSSEEDVDECRWKLYRSKFILDQSLRPEAAASLLKARSYSSQARPGCWRAVWIMRSLYFVRSNQRRGKVAHRTSWKIVKASVHIRISLISTCLRLALDTSSFPSKKVWGSCSTARRLTVSRSANSTNWPSMIFLANFAGIGACPGPTMRAFSGLVPDAE